MRVLITGGAGFIGRHLASELTGRGHEVLAIDALHPQAHPDPDAARRAFPGPVVVADVAGEETWRALPAADALVHLAAETGTGQSMYEAGRYTRVNVTGTLRAADYAARRGIPLVTVSSRAVYGEGRYTCSGHGFRCGSPCCPAATPLPSHEDDVHVPVSVYGETKSRAEDAACAAAGGRVPLTVVRPQNVVGPGQALHNPYTGVLAAFLAQLREGRPLTIHGDGTQTRDVVHVADVAALLGWLVEHPPSPGEPRVVNAGSGVRTTLRRLAEAALDGAPRPGPGFVHVPVRRAGDVTHACADLARLRALGAPVPRRTAREAVADFVAWAWERPGASSRVWDAALDELRARGLLS